MHIAKIRATAAAAVVLLAQSVGAFMAGPAARGSSVRAAGGGVAESTCHVNTQMLDTGAKLGYCRSSVGSRGAERSSFCSRQLPFLSSPSSRPRRQSLRGLGRRNRGRVTTRGRGTQLGMRASSGGRGGKGESTRNRILGTVVRF